MRVFIKHDVKISVQHDGPHYKMIRFLQEQTGQSTVEFVLVFTALLAMIIAFIACFNAGIEGVFTNLALQAASHTDGLSLIGMVQDALLY